MTNVGSALCANAIKCMELLHRIVFAWLIVSVAVAFLPSTASTAQLKLPYTDVNVPINSARWACAVVIFFTGVAGYTILKQLRELCITLASTEHLTVVLSYPSIATLGTPWLRVLLGYGFAFIQYSVGFGLWSPMPPLFGGSPDVGLAFIYAAPMFWFAWELRDWQKGIQPAQSSPCQTTQVRCGDA